MINAVAVIAVFDILKLDSTQAILNIANWKSLSGRGEINKIYFDDLLQENFFYLIDESYNSNPLSLSVALKTLAVINHSNLNISQKVKIRKVAILGDMMELGCDEIKIHESLSKNDYLENIDIFYCVGNLMYNFYNLLPLKKRGGWFSEVNKLSSNFMKIIQNGDIIMVKGSNSVGLNKLTTKILSEKKSKT